MGEWVWKGNWEGLKLMGVLLHEVYDHLVTDGKVEARIGVGIAKELVGRSRVGGLCDLGECESGVWGRWWYVLKGSVKDAMWGSNRV